jgi:hypothetical protein
MQEKVACFGLGHDQFKFVKKLCKDFKVVGFDENTKSKASKLVYKYYSTPFKEREEILMILRNEKIKKIYSFATEAPINLIGFLNSKLNLDGIKYNQTSLITNKYALRCKLKNKILQPKFFETLPNNFIRKKLLVKPRTGSASKNIFLLDTKNMPNIKKNCYFEEYINKGKMYAIDGFCIKGIFYFISLSEKKKFSKNFFVDKIIYFNINKKKIIKEASKLVQKHCSILKILNSPIHWEFLIFNKKIYSIDFHIRGPGSGFYTKLMNCLTIPGIYLIQRDLEKIKKFFRKKNFYSYVYFINHPNEINILKALIMKTKIKYEFNLFEKKTCLNINFDDYSKRIGVVYFKFNNYSDFMKKSNFLNKKLKKFS